VGPDRWVDEGPGQALGSVRGRNRMGSAEGLGGRGVGHMEPSHVVMDHRQRPKPATDAPLGIKPKCHGACKGSGRTHRGRQLQIKGP